jgi:hypothetical protein
VPVTRRSYRFDEHTAGDPPGPHCALTCVTTMPGLALRSQRAHSVPATGVSHFRGRVHVATYGQPPDPPATTAFITALRHAAEDPRASAV